MRRLKQHLPDYDKGYGLAFAETKSGTQAAIDRARTLAARVDPADDNEPYTGIVDLVQILINLKLETTVGARNSRIGAIR